MPSSTFEQINRSPYIVQNVPFQGIGAGLIANAIIPVGQTYLESLLYMTIAGVAATRAQINAQVEYVQALVNGIEMWQLSGNELAALAEFYNTGVVGDTGYLSIFYERPWMLELVAGLFDAVLLLETLNR